MQLAKPLCHRRLPCTSSGSTAMKAETGRWNGTRRASAIRVTCQWRRAQKLCLIRCGRSLTPARAEDFCPCTTKQLRLHSRCISALTMVMAPKSIWMVKRESDIPVMWPRTRASSHSLKPCALCTSARIQQRRPLRSDVTNHSLSS